MADWTAKMEKFCQEYLVDLNGTQAAIRAGYSENSAGEIASQNLAKVRIQERIEELKQEAAEVAGITPGFILGGLKTVAQRSMQAVPVLTKDGEPTGEYRFDANGANRSLELLGKHMRLFADVQEISGRNGLPIEFRNANELNDDELAAIATAQETKPTEADNTAASGDGIVATEESAQ